MYIYISLSFIIMQNVPSITIEGEEISVITEENDSSRERDSSYVSSQTDASSVILQNLMPRVGSGRESSFSNTMLASCLSDPLTYVQGSYRLQIRTYKSAIVLISIVVFFSLTQSFRISLKMFELSSAPNANKMHAFMICLVRNR